MKKTNKQNQKLLIENNRSEIEQSNYKLAFTILVMGCIAFLAFLFISLVVESYGVLTYAYLFETIVLTAFLLSFNKLKKIIPSTHLIYIGYGCLVIYASYTSAFITPDYTSVIILFFLFQIPIITIDKSLRVNTIVVAFTLIYMIIVIPFKDPRIIPDEIINCILFATFGICFGNTLRNTRLENFELKRQSLIREKTDYLTNLKNRKCLFEDLEMLSNQPKLSLFMIDIDNFKQYNDTYGHINGDQCLQKISQCFQTFGSIHNMSFYRYGGEEFVAIITDDVSVIDLAKKLNKTIFDLKISHNGSPYKFVTISIGAACYSDNCCNYNQLLSNADSALYKAKMQGRNCAVI